MNCIGKELAELERSLGKFSVEALAPHLKCSWIDEALRSAAKFGVSFSPEAVAACMKRDELSDEVVSVVKSIEKREDFA